MSALTIGSLFSGIGGLELGLEWAGLGPVVWQVEQSPFCRAVLAKHWPDATRYEDVRHVGRTNLAPVDVICGGFPCQDVSTAGRRAGVIEGTRSGLWFEFSRIVRELRPRYVIVENVAALLTLGLDAVLGELAACGYDAEWDCVPASAVGAPHQRDRIWIMADAHRGTGEGRPDTRSPFERWVAARTKSANVRRSGQSRSTHIGSGGALVGDADEPPAHAHAASGGSRRPTGESGWWAVEPNVGRVAHGIPARVDRLRALGNAVVPQVAEVVGRLILAREQDAQERAA